MGAEKSRRAARRPGTHPATGARRGIRVGVIGWGTIGSGVIRFLRESNERLAARLGAPIELVRVADLDLKRKREVRVPKALLSNDARAILSDPQIDVVVELMGGLEPARTFVLEAIRNGKAVVTANKALLAHHGPEIFAAAEKAGTGFGFEASVGGGIPIIRTLREALSPDDHTAVFGIVNGTANYILSTMAEEGTGFAEVLAAAQASGLAEADPTYDVDGVDSAHKLALLVQLAFGVKMPLDAVHTEGIRAIDSVDMAYARELGYVIKLLAVAKRDGKAVEARVHPTMIPASDPLGGVGGAYNAVCVHSAGLERTMYYGQGAGMMPTAAAVMADILDVARDRIGLGGPRLAPLGYPVADQGSAKIVPIGQVESDYYLRVMARDESGVLGRIAGHLGRSGISIASVVQRERRSRGSVPVILRTHAVQEKQLRRALARVAALDQVRGKPVAIRIEENPG